MNPREEGFYFPPEWSKHSGTWLTWPHNRESWPGNFEAIFPSYVKFVRVLAEVEQVNIIVAGEKMEKDALKIMGIKNHPQINFFHFGSNDAWCRDHGPCFLINPESKVKAIVNWHYNAWGEKYPPYDLDNQIPLKVAEALKLRCFEPEIVMEGGSIDINGKKQLITTKSCLLNPNRNPEFSKADIEDKLRNFYNIEEIIWLEEGIEGDDTDGHVDDIARFVNDNTIVCSLAAKQTDRDYKTLKKNFDLLSGHPSLSIVPLPTPNPVYYKKHRLPASYANFYLANEIAVVPTFNCQKDEEACAVLGELLEERDVIGIDSCNLVWGLGSFHCLSQQEPAL